MFEVFGLVVDLVPGVAEVGDEKRLDQPMPLQHPQGQCTPLVGERDRPVPLVSDQTLVAQPPDHLRYRRCAHPEPGRQRRRRHRRRLPLLCRIDDLDVVFRGHGRLLVTGRVHDCQRSRRAWTVR